MYANIALIIPDKPFELNEQVKLVPLPPTKYANATGDVMITGWGEMKMRNFERPIMTEILQKIKLKLITDEECDVLYREYFNIQPFQLCTELIDQSEELLTDTCANDMGGPVYSMDGHYLAGVVAPSVKSIL